MGKQMPFHEGDEARSDVMGLDVQNASQNARENAIGAYGMFNK
jgi:hypothetical protein